MPEPSDRQTRELDAVDELLAGVLDQPVVQRPAALEEVCAAHPSHADELRARFRLLLDMGLLEVDAAVASTVAAGNPAGFPERLGDFRLVRQLGGGGMGVVYLAEQAPLGREVALKLIRPEQLYFPGARAWFRREVEAIASLQHPGIVPIYTVGEAEGIPYFAMERVAGTSLATVLRHLRRESQERLSPARLAEAVTGEETAGILSGVFGLGSWSDACVAITLQVAEALVHAHERGVIHRDVKPSNVMLTRDGRAMLLDFGLAAREGSVKLTRTGAAMGSLAYMSPEQVRAEPLDVLTDVYSLGVTLYEMLTLQEPYFDESSEALKGLILAGQPKPVRVLNRKVSWDTETVCQTAMAPETTRRYPSMTAFAADLRRLLTREPIQARRPGRWLRSRRFVQRHPTLTATVGLGALLVVGLPTVLFLQQRSANRAIRAEWNRAEEEAEAARRVTEFLVDAFKLADPERSLGEVITVRQLLDDAGVPLKTELTEQPRSRAALLAAVGSVYRNLGLYDEARPFLEQAVGLAVEHVPGAVAPSRAQLGGLLRATGDLAGAERELAAAAEHWGAKPLLDDRVLWAVEMAELQHERGDRAKALATLADVEARCREAVDAERSLLRVLSGKIALLVRHAGYREALEILPETQQLASQLLSPDHPTHAQLLHDKARALRASGDKESALAAFAAAEREIVRVWGADHHRRATVLESQAFALADADRYDEGRDQLLEAERIRRAHLPEGHKLIGVNLSKQGELAMGAGDFDGARAVLAAAAEILKRTSGGNNHVLANLATQQMTSSLMTGKYELALAHGERARELYESLGEETENRAGFLELYGTVLFRRDRHVDAKRALSDCLRMRERLHGPDHYRVGHTLQLLAQVHAATGNAGAALEFVERALAQAAAEVRDARLGLMLAVKGRALAALERYEEAQVCLREGAELFAERSGADHPGLIPMLINHGVVLSDLRRFAEARDQLERALAIAVERWPASHPELIPLKRYLARSYHGLGEHQRAVAVAREALTLADTVLPAESPERRHILQVLVVALRASGNAVEAEAYVRRLRGQ